MAVRVRAPRNLKDLADPFFPVGRERLNLANGSFSGVEAIVNSQTGEPLGIVTPSYKLVTHKEAYDIGVSALDAVGILYNVKKTLGTKNGSVFYSEVEFPGHKFNAAESGIKDTSFDNTGRVLDEFIPTVIFKNSYNRTTSLQFMYGAYRLICSNGMIVGNTVQSVSLKHTTRLDINKIGLDFLQNLDKTIVGFKDLYQRLNSQSGEDQLRQALIEFGPRFSLNVEQLLPAGIATVTREKRRVVDFQPLAPITQYAVYNILTNVATHESRNETVRQNLNQRIAEMFQVTA